MKKLFSLLLLGVLSACLNTTNSNSGDEDKYGQGPDNLDPSAQSFVFAASRKILQEKCASCHFHDHSLFARYSERKWVERGFVVRGNYRASPLYQRLKGAGLGGNAENMPPGASLSAEEMATLRAWIMGESTVVLGPEGRARSALTALKNNKCMGCHAQAEVNFPDKPIFGEFSTDNEFVASGLIYPGYPLSSPLFKALRGYSEMGTMPLLAPALSESDAIALRQWIEQMRIK